MKRRRQVVVARRKRVTRTAVAAVKLIMAGAGIFCLAAATRNYVYTSPRFVVRHIGVTGNTHVTADTIIRESTIFEGRNIFGLDLSEAAVAIEKIPRIRSAQVRRIPPDEIQIEVTERKPLALILSGRLLCVDREARILAEYDPAHKLDAPIISGKSLAGAKVGDTVQVEKVSCALEIVEIINRLGLAGHLRISEINVDDPDNIVLVAEQSGATILLGSDNFEAKLWRLARVAETMECNEQLKVANLERLDMRFEAIVPAKFKEAHS